MSGASDGVTRAAVFFSRRELADHCQRQLASCPLLLASAVCTAHKEPPDVTRHLRRFAYFELRDAMCLASRSIQQWTRSNYGPTALAPSFSLA